MTTKEDLLLFQSEEDAMTAIKEYLLKEGIPDPQPVYKHGKLAGFRYRVTNPDTGELGWMTLQPVHRDELIEKDGKVIRAEKPIQ